MEIRCGGVGLHLPLSRRHQMGDDHRPRQAVEVALSPISVALLNARQRLSGCHLLCRSLFFKILILGQIFQQNNQREISFFSTAHAGGSTEVYSTWATNSEPCTPEIPERKRSKCIPDQWFYSPVQMRKEQELTFGWGE